VYFNEGVYWYKGSSRHPFSAVLYPRAGLQSCSAMKAAQHAFGLGENSPHAQKCSSCKDIRYVTAHSAGKRHCCRRYLTVFPHCDFHSNFTLLPQNKASKKAVAAGVGPE